MFFHLTVAAIASAVCGNQWSHIAAPMAMAVVLILSRELRQGSRVVSSWSSRPLPSGSLKEANEPKLRCSGSGPLTRNPSKQVGLVRASVRAGGAVEDFADLDVATEQRGAGGPNVGDDQIMVKALGRSRVPPR
jgi:hypothetical protein